jgi:hypothetical protein
MLMVGHATRWTQMPDKLAASIPGAELVTLEGRDHLNAVGEKRYKAAVERFFAVH